MIVLIVEGGGLAEEGVAVETKIARTEALAELLVAQSNDCLAASLNGKVRIVIGIEAQAGVVEIVAGDERWAPIDDPAFFRTEAVVGFLRGLADVHTIDEAGNGDEAGADVVINSVVGKVQAIAA